MARVPLAGPLGVASIAIAVSAGGVAAQGVPPVAVDAGEALREAERRARPAPGALPETGEIRFTSQTPPAGADEIRFVLEAVDLSGATIYDAETLAELWAELLGREIALTDAFRVAAAVQARYREDGYLFTRVVVPAQRIEGGRVRLEVIEAVITRVEIEEPNLPLGPVRALAERIAAPLEGRVNPLISDVERVLLLLNDIPGVVRAAAVPKVGEETRGAVELFINMEREAIDGTIFADNRQSPIIGDGLVGAVVSVNSWSPFGDSTAFSAFNSIGFDDFGTESFNERHTLQLEHTTFLGGAGAHLDLRGLWSESAPGDVVAQFGITGDQVELEGVLAWPALRSRALSLEFYTGFTAIEVGSVTPPSTATGVGQALVVDDHLRVARLGAEVVQRDARGYTEATVELRRGLSLFGASRAGDGELSRQDGSGRFWSVRGELERTLSLPEGFSLWGKAWGQWADRPLLATEEFSIGGPELGRAFHPSEFSDDLGAGAAAELRFNHTFVWDALRVPYELYGYADFAAVRSADPPPPSAGGESRNRSLFSAGAGVRAQLYGHTAINLEAARPINRPLAYNRSDAWRILFSATRRF